MHPLLHMPGSNTTKLCAERLLISNQSSICQSEQWVSRLQHKLKPHSAEFMLPFHLCGTGIASGLCAAQAYLKHIRVTWVAGCLLISLIMYYLQEFDHNIVLQ